MKKLHYVMVCLNFLVASALVVHADDPKDMKVIAEPREPVSDAGLYVAAYGGADFTNINDGSKYSIGNVGPTDFFDVGLFQGGGSTTNTVGGVGGLKVGYNFESYDVVEGLRLQPAVELEGLYIGGTGANHFSYASPETITVKSNYENAAVLLNGIVRFKLDSPFTPYVGLGIGTEYLNATNVSLSDQFGNSYGTYGSGNWALAEQGLVGVDYAFTKHWSLLTEYKFIIMDDPRVTITNFGHTGADYTYRPDYIGQNIGVVGIKYSF